MSLESSDNCPAIMRSAIEALDTKVRITDHDDENNLDLFCYVKCDPEDSGIIRQCRGIVFHGDTLVMQAFPYTTEYTIENTELPENFMNQLTDNIKPNECLFYEAHEGALIRMFYFGNKWYTSTHRKLDAFKSKWASRESFGQLFVKALESSGVKPTSTDLEPTPFQTLDFFQERLDKNKQYMFLVRNSSDNRIVCDPPTEAEPSVYHVGTFVNSVLNMDENIGLPYPNKHEFGTIANMLTYVTQIDSSKYQGLIAFAPGNKQYKILNKRYSDLFNVRGNEPSIKFRYLQIRTDKQLVEQLEYLYPHMTKKFDEYEQALQRVATRVYNTIVDRFIKKLYSTVSNDEFLLVRECQKWHEQNRYQNRVCLSKIYELIDKQSPVYLNRIIKTELGEIREPNPNTSDNHAGNNRNSNTQRNNKNPLKRLLKRPDSLPPTI